MHRTLGSAATILLLACPCVAQETTASTEFNQITQSPPVLNCAGRVIVTQNGGQYQGTVLMRGQVYIRDAFGHIVATSTPLVTIPPITRFTRKLIPTPRRITRTMDPGTVM